MLQKFLKVIEETKTIEPKDRLVVAVSGGPDSMCLLAILCKIRRRFGLSLVVAHVNHGLRGEESEKDAAFVRDFARDLDVPFYLHQADVAKYSSENRLGLEEAGRQVRYNFFLEVMRRERANKIVTAHHMEDQAETVLMRMIRGTSVEGLVGIQEKRGDGVVRPLLRFSKQELLEFLAEEKIPSRLDRSNLDPAFTRNRIRNQLMDQLREINPDVCGALCRLSTFAQTDCDFMQRFTTQAWQRFVTVVDDKTVLIQCQLFEEYMQAVSSRVVYQATRLVSGNNSGGGRDIRDVLLMIQKGKNGQELSIFQDIFAALEYGKIAIFRKKASRSYQFCASIGTGVKVPEAGMVFYAYMERKSEVIPAKNQVLFFLPGPITQYTIRNRKPGDQYAPRGLDGHYKLKELFINMKVPKRLRSKIPILEVNGEILWVFGARISSKFPIETASESDTVLVFEYQFMENGADMKMLLEQ